MRADGIVHRAAALALLLAACNSEVGTEGSIDWNAIPEWQLATRASLQLGGADVAEDQLFGNLRGAARLADGSIAVADVSTNDIRVFSPEGAHRYTVGRSGRGPGEFREIWGVFAGPGDTIWGFDQPSWKLVGYHGGTYQREMRLDRAWPLRWSGHSVIASVVPVTGNTHRPHGLQRAPMRIVVYGPRGDADTIARLFDEEEFLDRDRNWQTPLLARLPYLAAGSDFLALADGGSAHLQLLATTGDTLLTLPVLEVTGRRRDELVAARRAQRLKNADPEHRARAQAMLNEMPDPDHFADISGLAIDALDRIWIRPVHLPADSQPVWRVYDRTGRPLARIRIPVRLRIRELEASSLLVTERGEFDVPIVSVYPIRR